MQTLPVPTVPGKKCTKCGHVKPLTDFYFRARKTVRNSHCRECHLLICKAYRSLARTKARMSAYHHAYYLRNTDRYGSKRDRRKAELSAYVNDIKRDKGCALCPEREPICLSFHHIDPGEKSRTVGWLVNRGMARSLIDDEIAKCIIVCENCHRKIHAGIIVLPTH